MTDLDTPIPDPDPGVGPKTTGHPDLWRVVSFLAVAAATVLAVIAVLGARTDGDITAISGGADVRLETSRVTVGALGAPAEGQLLTLGLDPSQMVPVVAGAADATVPAESAALIALYGPDGSTNGLALIQAATDRSAVEISADSTARALLALTPALLKANLDLTIAQIAVIAEDPAFDTLVDALTTDSNLSQPNTAVELALAEILDRVPNNPTPDQGCDSVVDPAAYTAAGACVEPRPDGVAISNNQDRWGLLYANDSGRLCAALAPDGHFGDRLLVTAASCAELATLVAPGPIVDRALTEQGTVQRIRSAAALQMFASYVAPFADLGAGAAGFGSVTDTYVNENASDLVDDLNTIVDTNPGFVAALDTLVNEANPTSRHIAGIASARALISAGAPTQLIPGRIEASTGYLDLLSFFERVGERMVDGRTTFRWTADSVGDIMIAGAS